MVYRRSATSYPYARGMCDPKSQVHDHAHHRESSLGNLVSNTPFYQLHMSDTILTLSPGAISSTRRHDEKGFQPTPCAVKSRVSDVGGFRE